MSTPDPARVVESAPSPPISALAADFLCAGFVAAFGSTVLLASADLAPTNDMGVGPGYLPRVCGWLLIGLAVLIAVPAALRASQRRTVVDAATELRPQVRRALLVSAAVLGFALLLPYVGLLLAILTLVAVATRASNQISLAATLLIGGALALVCTGLFIFGLGLPLPVWPTLLP